jgi:hypothetical protein
MFQFQNFTLNCIFVQKSLLVVVRIAVPKRWQMRRIQDMRARAEPCGYEDDYG